MKRDLWKAFISVALLFCLSACTLNHIDELFAVPYTSEANQNLQDRIAVQKGDAQSISPLSGNYTKTVQLVDLDGDNKQEAVAFFRDNDSERPLKIVIFKQDEEGEYRFYSSIEGRGTDIYSIEYCDLVEDEALEILVSFQVSKTMQSLTAYSIHQDQTLELMRSGYTNYYAMDLTQNDKMDILLLRIDAANPTMNRVELYVGGEGEMQFHSMAPISEGAKAVQQLEQGNVAEESNALIATYEYGDNEQISDIFTMQESGIQNITLDEVTRRSEQTLRRYTGVGLMDMNDDGVKEIPVTESISGESKTISAENFWKINWMQFDDKGSAQRVLSTYHNNSDKWYLVLKEEWDGSVVLSRLENANVGERAIVFSYWEEDSDIEPLPFLAIYRLTASEEDAEEKIAGRIVLHQDDESIYCAAFMDNGWDSGLDEKTLKERFHAM